MTDRRVTATPPYPRVPSYSSDQQPEDCVNPMESDTAAQYASGQGGDYRRVASPNENTPILNTSGQPRYASDDAYNPNYPNEPVKTKRFYNAVQNILDELPSTRREVHNVVEQAARYRTRLPGDNVMRMMGDGDGRRSAPTRPRSGFYDPVDDDPVFSQFQGEPHISVSAAAATPVPWMHDELNQMDDMRNAIREQDSNMGVKRARARKLNSEMCEKKKKIGRFQLWWSLTLQSLYSWMSKTSHALERSSLWAAQIKSLQGKHGHHVGIYFKFLRWCLAMNALIMFIVAMFVVIPYALAHGFSNSDRVIYGSVSANNTEFDDFVGLFNGGGALNASAYFMGTYFLPDAVPFGLTNTTGSMWDPDGKGADGGVGGGYNIALAYLIVIGAVLLVSFFMIFWGVYDAIRQSVLQVGTKIDEQLAEVALCRLDFSINNPSSLALHRRDIKNEIKTLLDEGSAKEEYVNRMAEKWRWIYFKRVVINFIMLAILIICLYAIFVAVQQSGDTGAGSLVPALVLAVVNAVVPFLFEKLAFAEEWRTELKVIKFTIIRAIVLRFVGLYVFMYAAYRRHDGFECWESYIGQEAYTVFVIGSILFELLTGIFIDMLVTVCYNKSEVLREVLGEPAYFDTIKKTLELTYAQALVWVGTYFCPLLPLVGIIRVCLLFYVQKWSTMTWCQPKQKRFLSTHSLPKLIWSLFLASFVLIAIPLGYVIPRSSPSGINMPPQWQDRFVDTLVSTGNCNAADTFLANCEICFDAAFQESDTVCWNPTPGGGRFPNGAIVTVAALCDACPKGCGPFRNEKSAYSAVEREYSTWSDDFKGVVAFLGTTAFTVLLGFALLGCCLTSHARSSALLTYARKLQVERDMERLDKRWILEKYAITFEEARVRGESRAEDGYIDDLAPPSTASNSFHEETSETRFGGSRIVKQEAV